MIFLTNLWITVVKISSTDKNISAQVVHVGYEQMWKRMENKNAIKLVSVNTHIAELIDSFLNQIFGI